jgi:hypothetical protein
MSADANFGYLRFFLLAFPAAGLMRERFFLLHTPAIVSVALGQS